MRGSRARTNYIYSDMPPGSSVTSIISPDESQPLFVPTQQNHRTTTQLFFGHDSINASQGNVSGGSHQPVTGVMDGGCGLYQFRSDGIELPPLPPDVSTTCFGSGSGSDMGQGVWNEHDTSYLGLSEQVTTGFDPVGSGSYPGFDTSEFVQHSPLFGRMPSVSDGYDLGSSSSYFF
ncbi:hypothetical protein L1049_007020 [Liquidambar formosana]|uniref:Uncharacterized protein n=1 Tax=Liquidambar formosana TaxID=63359 RepID=A0AAP0RGI1_LIQFO